MKGKNALQKDEIVLENNSTAQHTEYENDTKAETKKQMIGCQCNDMMCCTIDEDVPRGELRRRRITHHLENVLSRCIPSLSLSSNATVPPIARQQARAHIQPPGIEVRSRKCEVQAPKDVLIPHVQI
eukprot:scaffold1902_cov80-Skeletonema_marinoi.AAC.7